MLELMSCGRRRVTKKTKSTLLKDIASVFVTNIFVLSISLISAVIVARALGAEGRGLLAAALIYPQLLIAITEGGMRQSAVFFLGQKKAPENQILGALVGYMFFAGIVGMGLVYSLMSFFGQQKFSIAMMVVAAAILPTTLAVNALKGIFLGKENIKRFNAATWIQKVVYVGAITVLFVTDSLTVFSAVAVTLLAAAFNLGQSIWYLKDNIDLTLDFNFNTLKSMMKIGVVYALALFFIQANYKIDVLILSWLTADKNLGQYAVAVQLGELLWQLPAAVLVVLMSKSANSHDSSIILSVCKATRLTFFLTILSSIGLSIICYYAIEPVFGNEFSGSFQLIMVLIPGLILASVFKSLNAYYAGKGQPYFTIWIMGIAVVINVFLNFLLIPQYDAVGAAVASTISYTISAVGSTYLFAKRENVSYRNILLIRWSDFSPIISKLNLTINKLGSK